MVLTHKFSVFEQDIALLYVLVVSYLSLSYASQLTEEVLLLLLKL
jgi:hypothetical protein